METLEIHSKDYLVKWVYAPDNSTLAWQAKPLKKSINFGIYRKDGNDDAPDIKNATLDVAGDSSSNVASASDLGTETRDRSLSTALVNRITELSSFKSKSRLSTLTLNLSNSGLALVKDYHKLVAGELVKGTCTVEKGGMIAFIFDNSFSKTIAKKVLFSATPLAADGTSRPRRSSTTRTSRTIGGSGERSLQTLPEESSSNILLPKNGEMIESVLLKRKRKKLQGYTKRYFILNFKYGTLSYFKGNDNKLRGQMPIYESTISANSKTREIFIDSGMEVWDLKALSDSDFNAWVKAFNAVKSSETGYVDPEEEAEVFAALEATHSSLISILDGFESAEKTALRAQIATVVERLEGTINKHKNHDVASVTSDNEFYDANDYLDEKGGGVVFMEGGRKTDSSEETENEQDDDVSSSSDSDSDNEDLPAPTASVHEGKGEKSRDASLYPLPHDRVERQVDIPPFKHDPPSLLSFVRKNVGKDLSALSMPVDMNEPLTILQKYAECLEYSDLIDNAIDGSYPEDSGEKILRIAAFAVSHLASIRMKIRSCRKPFNPLLGETFELVREDKGFRLVCEKVSHRPPVFAMFAESADWTLAFSPSPSQKFWGKTSELYTKGNMKLTIKPSGEVYTWNQPTCVLKNIIAGEKYTEPTTSVTVKSSTGQKAVVEFGKGGMFSGRSESLTIKAYDSSKSTLDYSITGKWTESMTLKTKSTEKLIWEAGKLLPNLEKKFGFSEFAASLNLITPIEEGKLPPTDSRLRPDMKVYAKGDIPEAESLKKELEENQRQRRKKLEDSGEDHIPLFFTHHGDKEHPDSGEWVYKDGDDSYWSRREKQNWDGLIDLW